MSKDFGRTVSMIVACGFHCCLFELFIMGVVGAIFKLTNIPSPIFGYFTICCLFAILVVDYLILFRDGKYLAVFSRYDQLIDTPVMKKKLRIARIFSLCIVIIGIIGFSIIDYINRH